MYLVVTVHWNNWIFFVFFGWSGSDKLSSLVRIQILKLVTVFKSYELKNIFVGCFSCFSVILIHIIFDKIWLFCNRKGLYLLYSSCDIQEYQFLTSDFFSDLEFSSFAYEEICKHERCSYSVFISSSCHTKFDFLDDCFFYY